MLQSLTSAKSSLLQKQKSFSMYVSFFSTLEMFFSCHVLFYEHDDRPTIGHACYHRRAGSFVLLSSSVSSRTDSLKVLVWMIKWCNTYIGLWEDICCVRCFIMPLLVNLGRRNYAVNKMYFYAHVCVQVCCKLTLRWVFVGSRFPPIWDLHTHMLIRITVWWGVDWSCI